MDDADEKSKKKKKEKHDPRAGEIWSNFSEKIIGGNVMDADSDYLMEEEVHMDEVQQVFIHMFDNGAVELFDFDPSPADHR